MERRLQDTVRSLTTKLVQIASFESDAMHAADYDRFAEHVLKSVRLATNQASQLTAVGWNLGWQGRSGVLEIEQFVTGHDILKRVLPDTCDYHLRLYADINQPVVLVTCSHHDVPTGECYALCSEDAVRRHRSLSQSPFPTRVAA